MSDSREHIDDEIARRFLERFRGLSRAYGRYLIPDGLKANAKGKIESPDHLRKTVEGAVTVELWRAHLEGTDAIGIVPIDDKGTVHFAAIDIDVYPLDLPALEKQIKELGLPLIVCRTKSGGAHLYIFFKKPAPAPAVRDRLSEFAVRLGYPGVEIFPKQTRLASENDTGNWINMPYQAGATSTRYAIRDGVALLPVEFLDYADESAIDIGTLRKIELPASDKMLEGSPPCLEILVERGESSYRNNAMFSIGVYLRKRFPGDWTDRMDAFNQRAMVPPLSKGELADVIRSLTRKGYSFKCKDEPIVGICNREVCLKREFGVGSSANDPGVTFGQLIKLDTEPPTWIWSVDAMNVELTTEELFDQRAFQRRAAETLNKVTALVKQNTWAEMLADHMARLIVHEVPDDATREGQLLVHLQRFCTSRAVGKSMDELLMGKPFTDGDRTYFVTTDFLQYLQQHRVSGIDERRLFTWLREHDAKSHKKSLKGKKITCWSMPKFDEQTTEFDVPRRQQEEAM